MNIEKLRIRRVVARITAHTLATRAHISPAKFSYIERGLTAPTKAELERIANALAELEVAKRAMVETAARVGLPVQP